MIELKYGTRRVINFRGAKKVVGGLTEQNKISVLLYISKEFANSDKEEDLFNTVITLCNEIFECTNTTLWLCKKDTLLPIKSLKEVLECSNSATNEGYFKEVFTGRKPILLSDLTGTPQYKKEGDNTHCVMCVPIINKEEILGVISVESDTPHYYKTADLELLEALSSQLGLALKNVRLIEGLISAKNSESRVLTQLEWDLKMGRSVQRQVVQTDISPWNGIYFSSFYEPMVEVSGDYFDVVRQGNTSTIIMVDVSGHGIPAALITMAIHHQFRRCVLSGLGLTEIMAELGRLLKPQLPESTYFTAFILRMFGDYSFAYVNGGHQQLVHFKNNGEIDFLDTSGLPLGILDMKKFDYEEKQGKINPGDHLMLFTDGFTEQKNDSHEEYGLQRLVDTFLKENTKLKKEGEKINVHKIICGILEDWKTHRGDNKNGDDLSMILLQCNPNLKEAISYYKNALTQIKQGHLSEALESALQAYSIEPSLKENLLFLGKTYYNQGEYEKSIKYIKEYINSSGEDTATIHYLHGKALFKAEKILESKMALKKSLSIDHTFGKASLLLARCYLKENSLPKAIRILQQGVKSTPYNDALKVSLVKLENLSLIKA
ncbi:MAG: SpoIIE family protein phosphatase [Leptospiraceae bacterium]|nr:SpoIIE family protein phosphatase [Leptospiraceae bacterium]MCP5495011.1 SpoIIE family protein phosphatase [Leptospiraceae bacterium]